MMLGRLGRRRRRSRCASLAAALLFVPIEVVFPDETLSADRAVVRIFLGVQGQVFRQVAILLLGGLETKIIITDWRQIIFLRPSVPMSKQ